MNLTTVITTAFAFVATGTAALASDYVRVTVTVANIRLNPSLTATIVTKARSGDVFKLNETLGDWYRIFMFSGEYRYLHFSVAEPASAAPALPSSVQTRRRACIEIVKAQDRADREATAHYPTDFEREIDLQRLLYDRYELPIFHKYQLPPARSGTLNVECAKKGWLPRIGGAQ